MKIPQREDQVQLDAPRTQAGRAVQPVEGSLGDSYIAAMRGMSKELNELSALQFDLAKNAMEGQINSFDIYVNARTKQYNEELALARNNEQINKLLGDYQRDIANTGTEMLGNNLYQNWYNAKGGTTIAGSVYAANLSNAQLQIKLNNERLDAQGRELLTQAGTAETPEQREERVKQYYDILKRNVDNGTITEATAFEKKQNFNYQLTTSLVIKSMEDEPEETAKKLRTDENFAPQLTFTDRLRLAEQAEAIAYKRQGTAKGQRVKDSLNIWVPLYQAPAMAGLSEDKATGKYTIETEIPYYNEQGKKVGILHGSYNDIARQVYDISTRNENQLRYVMQALYKQAGKNVPLSEISMDDARSFRKEMRSDYISEENTPQYRTFKAKDAYIQTLFNEDSFYQDDKGNSHLAKGTDFLDQYKDGNLKSLKEYGVIVDRIGKINEMLNNNTTAVYLNENDSDYVAYWDKRNNYTDALIYSIQNNKVAKPKKQWEKEMVSFMKPILDKIDSNYPGFDTDRKKNLFVTAFLEQNDATTFFNKDDKNSYYLRNKDNSTAARNSIKQSLIVAGISDPESYIPSDVKIKSDLQLNLTKARPFAYMQDVLNEYAKQQKSGN